MQSDRSGAEEARERKTQKLIIPRPPQQQQQSTDNQPSQDH